MSPERPSILKEAALWLLTTGAGFLLGTALMGAYLWFLGQPTAQLSASDPEAFLFANALLLIGALLVPALVVPLLLRWRLDRWHGLTPSPSGRTLWLGMVMLLTLYPFLMGVEYYAAQWMPKAWTSSAFQTQLRTLYDLLLQIQSPAQWALRVLWIAVIPAVAEEFYFRGLTQQLFQRWMGRPSLAILLSAFLFAALHMQAEGFLSRWFLGVFLGYLFWKSRSIWVPVAVHFFNNMLILSLGWLHHQGWLPWDPAGDVKVPWALMGLSLVVTLIIGRLYGQPRLRKKTDKDWTKVYETTDPYWARILEGHLQSLAIPAVLMNKRDSAYGFGHLEIWVPRTEAERARNVIEEALSNA